MKVKIDISEFSTLAVCECGWRHLTDGPDNAWRLALGHWEKTGHGGKNMHTAVNRRIKQGTPMAAHL